LLVVLVFRRRVERNGILTQQEGEDRMLVGVRPSKKILLQLENNLLQLAASFSALISV